MKRILLSLLIISACTSNQSTETTAADDRLQAINDKIDREQDSLKKVNLELIRVEDSITLARQLKDVDVAYGKIKLGMSEKAYKKVEGEYFQKIGMYEYSFQPAFYENKLYRLRIKSMGNNANEYDTYIKSGYRDLREIIETKYGQGENRSFPKFNDLKESTPHMISTWKIGYKQIDLGVEQDDYRYYVVMHIRDNNLYSLAMKAASEKGNTETKKAAQNF
jgi:hypothetical protein